MLDRADRFDAGLQAKAREIEEPKQGLVSKVEEEVRRAMVVTILHQLDEREAQKSLVELDRLLHIRADQREVVNAATNGVGTGRRRAQVLVSKFAPPGLELDELRVCGHRVAS